MTDTVALLLRRNLFVILVGVFAIAALLEDLSTPRVRLVQGTFDRGPQGLIAGVLVGVTVLALLRPRLGALAPLGGLVLLGAASIWAGAWVLHSPFVFVLVMLLCAASGYGAKRGFAFAGLPVLWAVASVATSRDPNPSLAMWVGVLVYMTFAWVVGVVAGLTLTRARSTEERIVRVERERHELSQRAVIEERRRIARELHDVIAHSVSVMTVQTGAVRRLLTPAQEREREALLSVEQTGRQALNEMRRLVGLLKKEADDEGQLYSPQPGMGSLDSLIGTMRQAGLSVDVLAEGERRDLPPGVDLAAYRVLQEALTNALKHASPRHASVHLRWSSDQLEIEVANQGRGDGKGGNGGYGNVGMKERVALYGGQLDSGPGSDGGYVVHAMLPIGAET